MFERKNQEQAQAEIELRKGVSSVGALFGMRGIRIDVNNGNSWGTAKTPQGIEIYVNPDGFPTGPDGEKIELTKEEILYGSVHEVGHAVDMISPSYKVHTKPSDAFFWNLIDDTVINSRMHVAPTLDRARQTAYPKLFPTMDMSDLPKHVQLVYSILLGKTIPELDYKFDPEIQSIVDSLRNHPLSSGSTVDIIGIMSQLRTTLQDRIGLGRAYIKPIYDLLLKEDKQASAEQNAKQAKEGRPSSQKGQSSKKGQQSQSEDASGEQQEAEDQEFVEIYEEYDQKTHGSAKRPDKQEKEDDGEGEEGNSKGKKSQKDLKDKKDQKSSGKGDADQGEKAEESEESKGSKESTKSQGKDQDQSEGGSSDSDEGKENEDKNNEEAGGAGKEDEPEADQDGAGGEEADEEKQDSGDEKGGAQDEDGEEDSEDGDLGQDEAQNEGDNQPNGDPQPEEKSGFEMAQEIMEAIVEFKEAHASDYGEDEGWDETPRQKRDKSDDSDLETKLAGYIREEMNLDKRTAEAYIKALNKYQLEINAVSELFLMLAATADVMTAPRFDTRADTEGKRLHPLRLSQAAIQTITRNERAIWQPITRRGKRREIAFGGLDIHLVVDVSVSMAGSSAKAASATALILLEGLELAKARAMIDSGTFNTPDVRAQVIAFGSSAQVLAPLSIDIDPADKGTTYEHLLYPGARSTYVAEALRMVAENANDNPERDQLTMVITDGAFSDIGSAERAVQEMEDNSYVIQVNIQTDAESVGHDVVKLKKASDLPSQLYPVISRYVEEMIGV